MFDATEWLFMLAILLFIAGFILIGVEMVTPGLHVPGFTGTVCLIAAVFIVSDSLAEGAIITIAVLFLLGIMLAVILGLLYSGKLKSPIILSEKQDRNEGYLSSGNLKHMVGRQGVAVTDLRPVGIGSFEGSNYNVITEGNYILKGAKLIIYKAEGSKLIVKEPDK